MSGRGRGVRWAAWRHIGNLSMDGCQELEADRQQGCLHTQLSVLGRPGRLALGDSRWRHDKGGKEKPGRETSGLLSFHLCHISALIFQYPKAIWLSGSSSVELRLIGFVMAFKLKERRARLPLTPWAQYLSSRKMRAELGSVIRIAPGFEVVP